MMSKVFFVGLLAGFFARSADCSYIPSAIIPSAIGPSALGFSNFGGVGGFGASGLGGAGINGVPYNAGPNIANGRAIGGQTPQSSGQAVSSGQGPAVTVNSVNNAVSRSNAVPNNYQQATLPGRTSYGCVYGLFC